MSAHLSPQELDQYRRRLQSAIDLLAADDHLAECEQCRERLGEMVPTAQAWQTLRASLSSEGELDHLGYEQLTAYVDEKLNEVQRGVVEKHLDICQMCAAEFQDLRDFSHELGSLPRSPGQSGANALPKVSRHSGWRQFSELLKVRWPVLAGATVLLLAVAGILYFQMRVGRQSTPLIVTVSPPPLPSSPTPPGIESGSPNIILALNDGGGRMTLDQEGRLLAPQPLPAAYEQMIKRALKTERVEMASPAGLNVKTGSLMGGGEKAPFKLLAPVAKVIETDQPSFRWESLAGAMSYTVSIYDPNFTRVMMSPSLTTNEWRAPQTLPRGIIYSWQVKAVKDGREVTVPEPPAPESKFKVLEQARAEELAQARRQFSGSHLTLGLLYARMGMQGEAAQELQALLSANPDSPLIRKLLRSVTSSGR
jgi:predicted anti-sigma-YlaC factor YlaD